MYIFYSVVLKRVIITWFSLFFLTRNNINVFVFLRNWHTTVEESKISFINLHFTITTKVFIIEFMYNKNKSIALQKRRLTEQALTK